MNKILIVDDNEQIVTVLVEYAKKEGYIIKTAFDGEEALQQFYEFQPDIVLLDVMMPRIDGYEVCKEIRKESMVPVIMITAKGEDFEKIMGLDIGADDYIVKPFSPAEIMARIRAILRRVDPLKQAKKIVYKNLEIDLETYTVKIENNLLKLTKKEIELLWLLLSNKNKIFSRENLLDSIWGIDYAGDMRTVDSHIKRLRSKIEPLNHSSWNIKTVWGVGYKFEE